MVSLRGKHSVVKNNQNVSFHSNMTFQIPVACLQYFQAHNSYISRGSTEKAVAACKILAKTIRTFRNKTFQYGTWKA